MVCNKNTSRSEQKTTIKSFFLFITVSYKQHNKQLKTDTKHINMHLIKPQNYRSEEQN